MGPAMPAATLPRPGLLYGPYPQRLKARPPLWAEWADGIGNRLLGAWRSHAQRERVFLQSLARARQAPTTFSMELAAVRASLSRHGLTDELVARAQCLAAQAIEQATGKRPYDTQHRAAWAMLGDRLVEMDTGEGKSIATLMAAATAALAGVPVHVITANDYLAARDAEAAAPVLGHLGLSAAAIVPDMDGTARRAVYARDVVFCTARELGFDYMRDQLQAAAVRQGTAGEPPVLRGLNLALIDEADSVLIDHARTPLVIAVRHPQAMDSSVLQAVWRLSGELVAGTHYTLKRELRRAELLPAASEPLRAALADVAAAPRDPRVSLDLLRQALVMRHLLHRDRHYLVQRAAPGSGKPDEIVLIDETTGRAAPGTQWSRGLHQLAAIKEGCPPADMTRTAEQLTLQTLFSRYWRLGGLSGTLRESRLELFVFYRLRVVRMAPRLRSQRRDLGLRVHATREQQFDAVVHRARECLNSARPVLVGTESVAESDALAQHLRAAGLAPTVLNARHDADEAQRIARAGVPGVITVTTNMAGRGTDIALTSHALEAGGLHVISCTLNASRRIDRQLFGRTARNGQPGSFETTLCLSSGVFARCLPLRAAALLRTLSGGNKVLPAALGRGLARASQGVQAWRDFHSRWQLVSQDRRTQALLSYTRGAI
jgi:preprotein translocase subunit SecA